MLVVEDSALLRCATEEILRGLGCDAVGAATGAEAIAACAARSFDLVLMDLGLPLLDGYKTALAIRSRLGARAPAIVALSARLGEGERGRAAAAGMCDALEKPISAASLRALLERRGCSVARTAPVGGVSPMRPELDEGVDLSVLRRLAELEASVGPPGVVAGLVASFSDLAVERHEALRLAAERGDVARLAATAHLLSSDAASVGATQLAQRSVELERAARAGAHVSPASPAPSADPTALGPLVAAVERELAVAARVLVEWASREAPRTTG